MLPNVPQFAFGLFNPELNTPIQSSGTGERLVFVGDILLGRNVERLISSHSSDYPWQRLPEFAASTLVVGNFEASIPRVHKPTPDYTFQFSVATSVLPAMRDAGVTHLSLANNHSYDHDDTGFAHTKKALSEAGFFAWGDQTTATSSAITYVSINGQKVALLALYAVDGAPTESSLDALFIMTATADRHIVYVHWGTEYELKPSAAQRSLATQLSARGADLIIGHHPHVVQSVEWVGDTLVLYSLGNFIFDQYFSADVQEGLMATVTFLGDKNRVELTPITNAGQLSSPREMTSTETERFLNNLAERSSPELKTAIENGEIEW